MTQTMKKFDSCAPPDAFVDYIDRNGYIPDYLLDIFLYSESVKSRLCAVEALEQSVRMQRLPFRI